MSSLAPKKTLAQLRAEKSQRREDLLFGRVIVADVIVADVHEGHEKLHPKQLFGERRYDELDHLLGQADRAYELLKNHPEDNAFRTILLLKARIYHDLGQMTSAVAAFRRADEVYAAAECKGLNITDDIANWRYSIITMGFIFLRSNQLEEAKRCFLRVLEWPHAGPTNRVNALHGLACFHKERKDWGKTIECSEAALELLPKVKKGILIDEMEERLLLLLADAAEGQGKLRQAREYDEKVKRVWFEHGGTSISMEFTDAYRRWALEEMAAGRPHDAACILDSVPRLYLYFFKEMGINLMDPHLKSLIEALKVLADALVSTAVPHNQGIIGPSESQSEGAGQQAKDPIVHLAERIRADVEETEAILAGYFEGALEETRRELEEHRRTAARTEAAVAEATTAIMPKKSKAAKRKQQKRKAQQKKKAVDRAEAAAVEATVGVGKYTTDGMRGQEGHERGEEEREEQSEDRMIEGEEEEEEEEVVTARSDDGAIEEE